MIQKHFFKALGEWIEEMEDPRNVSYITYTQSDFVYMGILKNICGLESMRQMEESFNEETCIRTLSLISGHSDLKEMPHYDSLNYYLEKLSPECLSSLRRKMVLRLIRGKQFYKNRLLGKYWRIVLDGTGLYHFREKHCDNCLSTTKTGKDGKEYKIYYHKVLDAKLILSNKIVISLVTEFIENENEKVSKQDCELNAAKRLLKQIKEEYKRLPICIQGDALYAAESVMELCRKQILIPCFEKFESFAPIPSLWKESVCFWFRSEEGKSYTLHVVLEDGSKQREEQIGAKEIGKGFYYGNFYRPLSENIKEKNVPGFDGSVSLLPIGSSVTGSRNQLLWRMQEEKERAGSWMKDYEVIMGRMGEQLRFLGEW